MTAKEISDILGGRQTGKGYVVNCPVCDDAGKHLFLTDGDLRVLLSCKHRCPTREIIAALREMGAWEDSDPTLQEKRDFSKERQVAEWWRRGKLRKLEAVLAECTREIDKAAAQDRDPSEARQKLCRETTKQRLELLSAKSRDLIALYHSERGAKQSAEYIEYGRKYTEYLQKKVALSLECQPETLELIFNE